MSTLKVTNLQHPSAASANVTLDSSGNAAFSGGITGVTSVNGGQLGARNLLINSAFNVWQRGNSFSAPANGTYTADRFAIAQTSAFLNVARDTDTPDGFSYSLKTTVNSATSSPAAGDLARIYYTSEAQDVTHLGYGSSAAKTTSLSFWVKSTVAADYTVFVYVDDPARSIVKGYTINSANTWQYITITIAGDTGGSGINSDNGAGITLEFNLVAGSNYNTAGSQDTWTNGAGVRASGQTANCAASGSTWQITGVQLEVGDTPTSYQHESYGTTIQKCLRYYWRATKSASNQVITTAIAYSSTVAVAPILFPVPMRSSPSFSISATSDFVYLGNNSSADPSQFQTDVVSVWSAQAYMIGSFTQGHAYLYRFDGDSPSGQYFALDAEL